MKCFTAVQAPLLGLLAVVSVTASVATAAEETARESLRALSDVFAQVAEEASPAVVFIQAEREIPQRQQQRPRGFGGPFGDPFHDEFFRRFFGDRHPAPNNQQRQDPTPRYRASHGSGFIVSDDGFILTNHHVVSDADKLTVRLQDGEEFPARLVGSDDHSDLAVLQVDAGRSLPTITKGRSDDLRVGEWVVAIGNPFGLSHTVTAGIVSAKGRSRVGIADYEDFIQTDAAINPGNSGGPLLNLDGEVVGINTAIFSRSGGYMGIGFAIPIDMARAIYLQLRDNGTVVRGYLGVGIQDLTAELAESFGIEEREGVVITQVQEGSAAEAADMRDQDVVLALQGAPVGDATRFRNAVAMIAPGAEVALDIWRDGERLTLSVTMGQRSDVAVAESAADEQLEQWGIAVSAISDDHREQFRLESSVQGVVVTEVEDRSRAARAGVRPGQVVVAINRHRIASLEDFQKAMAAAKETQRPVRLLLRQGEWNVIAVLPQ
ncbi:MAG: DegQ family serine endoprotease [Planctomycetota bacterium]|nr:MAG: DegQ family serine endoprotease [Planctomycetota bacterium]